MASPQRARTVSVVVCLAGAGACVAGALLGEGKGAVFGTLAIGGGTIAFFGAISAVVEHFKGRSAERLRRGNGEIARWTVDAGTWDAFVELNERLNAERGADLVNTLSPRRSEGRGVEVIVGSDAVLVGEEYFWVPRGSRPVLGIEYLAGPPACIELALLWPGSGDQSDSRNSLRFPVATGGAGAEAAHRVITERRAAISAVEARPLIRIKRPRAVMFVFLGIAVVCAGLFAAGILLRGRMDLGQFPAMSALLGSLLGLGSLVLALVMYVRSRMREER